MKSLVVLPAALGGLFSVIALTHSSFRFVIFGIIVGLAVCGALWFLKSAYLKEKANGMVKTEAEVISWIVAAGVPAVAFLGALLLGGSFPVIGHLLNMVAVGSVAGTLLPAPKRV